MTTTDVPTHGQASPGGRITLGEGNLKELAALAHVAMARAQAVSLPLQCREHLAVGVPFYPEV